MKPTTQVIKQIRDVEKVYNKSYSVGFRHALEWYLQENFSKEELE